MSKRVDIAELERLIADRAAGSRMIVAIVGAPGSGKSTLAEEVVSRLNAGSPGKAAILPGDGFHYDDGLLRSMGRLAYKGAPDTFDVGGLRHIIARLRANDEERICVPVFDRDMEISRAGARMIENSVEIIVVEGNYLLLAEQPWTSLSDLFDITVMIETDRETLRERLTQRWKGYDLPADEIRRKVEENDLRNADTVMRESAAADFTIAS
jgi:pantothenate kinase